jgi:hypothetical protein
VQDQALFQELELELQVKREWNLVPWEHN